MAGGDWAFEKIATVLAVVGTDFDADIGSDVDVDVCAGVGVD